MSSPPRFDVSVAPTEANTCPNISAASALLTSHETTHDGAAERSTKGREGGHKETLFQIPESGLHRHRRVIEQFFTSRLEEQN